MSTTPTRMPDYNPAGRRRFKPLRDRSDVLPRTGDILSIEPQTLIDALAVVVTAGCAIMFSPTQDGGALSITVYHGEERSRDYVASAEEFTASLLLARDLAEAHLMRSTPLPIKGPVRASEKLTS